MMDEIMMKYEDLAKYIPLIEKIALDSDRVLLKDNKCNRIIEVLLAYSLPELYSTIKFNGVEVPSPST